MSFFDDIAAKAAGVSQSFYGDSIPVTKNGVTSNVVAVFYSDEVEFEGTISTELVCEFTKTAFTPIKGVTLTYKTELYKISHVETNESLHVCILRKA